MLQFELKRTNGEEGQFCVRNVLGLVALFGVRLVLFAAVYDSTDRIEDADQKEIAIDVRRRLRVHSRPSDSRRSPPVTHKLCTPFGSLLNLRFC